MDARARGNTLFSQKKYREAIESYTSAIAKDQKDYKLYANRALCYIKLEEWSNVMEDCQIAVQNDPSIIKAHFYLGQAQMELNNYDAAIDSLQTAFSLAKEQRKNFGDDIASALRLAKKKKWQQLEEKRLSKKSSLLVLLNELLDKHKESLLSNLDSSSLSPEEQVKETEAIMQQHVDHVAELKQVFEDADQTCKSREVPDYLCGKISFELMKDPCITPSGITYDRKDIEEHLNRVGHFDPITRTKLTSEQLVPNLAMKEVVDTFLTENSWVDEY